MRQFLASFALALAAAGAVARSSSTQPARTAPSDTLRYVVVFASRPAGEMKVWTAGDARHVQFEFNDRGRGPRLTSRIVLGSSGIPNRIETTGHDYLKNPVRETYHVAGDTGVWQNSAEQGRAPATRAFYSSFDGSPEEFAIFARALLASPARKLAILPAGAASIEKVEGLTVRAGGQEKAIVHYAIAGLGFAPARIWLDRSGEFFASGSTWSMTIRKGWEAAQADIIKAQDKADATRATALAKELARKPAGALVFRSSSLFDSETGRMRPRTTVIVSGNRITAVGPDDSIAIPRGAEVIDAAGRTLMPGLWDMHVHIGDDDGLFQLAAGVTTVRDLANDTDELLARRKRFDERALIGPRVILGGFMDGPGPFAGPTKVLVSTEKEARAAVAKYDSLGYEQIKVYSSIKPELVPAIVDEAHKGGLRVSGHIPAYMTADSAVKLGFDEIQHVNMLFLNFWGDSVKDTRTPLRFTAVAERAALLDLGSVRVREFIKLLKERNVVVDPTVNIFEGMFTARKGTIDPGYAAIADRMPPQVRRGFLGGGLPVPEGMDQRYRDSFAATLKLVKMMYDAGITIVPGTDAFAGFALHRELELYAQAGIPANEVLRIATLIPARLMKRDKDLGSIASGKLADLILIDGNPAERISDIRRAVLVVKDGIVYDPEAMYRAIGVGSATRSDRSSASHPD